SENGRLQDTNGHTEPTFIAQELINRTAIPQMELMHHGNGDLSQLSFMLDDGDGSTPNIPRSLANDYRIAREKAILVDRFSRVAFPLTFSVLNILYWCSYFEW
ncbi:unnamed protein product, partial [Meganyctiphanes norvegica]